MGEQIRTFKEHKAALEALKLTIKPEVEETVKALFAEAQVALRAHGYELEAIRWRQYTPGYNDGDPCTFDVRDTEYSGTGPKWTDEVDDRQDGDNRPWFGKWHLPDAVRKIFPEVKDQVDQELLLTAFGDGFQITVSADGIEVEEYDCGY